MRQTHRRLMYVLLSSLLALGGCGATAEGTTDPDPECYGAECSDPQPDPDPDPTPDPKPISSDAGVDDPLPPDATADPPASSCEDVSGSWKGKITGKANTLLPNLDIVGDAEMTIVSAGPDKFTVTSLKIVAWSETMPAMKVPLETVGQQQFNCNDLDFNAPIEVMGLTGSGSVKGKCAGGTCSGTFAGKDDSGLMDATGQFTMTKQ